MKSLRAALVMTLSCIVLALAARQAQAQINDPSGVGGDIVAPSGLPLGYEPVAPRTDAMTPWRSLAFLFAARAWSSTPAIPIGAIPSGVSPATTRSQSFPERSYVWLW